MNSLKSRSIASQIIIMVIVLVGLAVVSSSSILIYLGFRAQIAELNAIQYERSRAVAGEIRAYVDDLQRSLAYLARVQGLSGMDAAIQESFLTGLMRQNSAYETVQIIDNQGDVIRHVSHDTSANRDNLAASNAFLYAYRNQEEYVSSVEYDEINQLPIVIMAVPIRNEQDEVDGILLARVNIRFLWRVLERSPLGESGYSYIIDRSRFLIAQDGETVESFLARDISNLPYLHPLLNGEISPQNSYIGLHGEEVIGVRTFIPVADWNLIIELPTSELYAPVYARLSIMTIALVISGAIAGLASVAFSRRITQPLKQIELAAQQISSGNLDVQLNIEQQNELGVLANTINTMSAQLRETIDALTQSESRHLALLSAIPDLIFRCSSDGVFLDYHSNSDSRLFLPASQFIGRKLSEVLPADSAAIHLKHIEEALETGKEQVYEYALAVNGQVREFEARLVVSGQNEVLTIVRDITDLKELENEHLKLLLEQERIGILGNFITNASHEFRTPISIMATSLYLLKKTTDPAKQSQQLAKVENQLQQIVSLVESLTLMAKIDSGLYRFGIEEMPVMALFNMIEDRTKTILEREKIRLDLQVPEQGLAIACDKGSFKTALNEIVDNAIAFTPEGGCITLSAKAENEAVIIEISDTGTGISEKDFPFIFDRFYRSDKTGTSRGFGLGLPIAKAIVEAHKGRIEAESRPAQGSIFRIILPSDSLIALRSQATLLD